MGKKNGTRYSKELKDKIIAEYAKKRIRETLINCDQRINQCHHINYPSFDKLPFNRNLRSNLLERSEEPLLNASLEAFASSTPRRYAGSP